MNISNVKYKNENNEWQELKLPSQLIPTSLVNQITELETKVDYLEEVLTGIQTYVGS